MNIGRTWITNSVGQTVYDSEWPQDDSLNQRPGWSITVDLGKHSNVSEGLQPGDHVWGSHEAPAGLVKVCMWDESHQRELAESLEELKRMVPSKRSSNG